MHRIPGLTITFAKCFKSCYIFEESFFSLLCITVAKTKKPAHAFKHRNVQYAAVDEACTGIVAFV